MPNEFPEQNVETADLVEEVLRGTYFKLKGHYPRGGGYIPCAKLVKKLESIFDDQLEMVEFLKNSLGLHFFLHDREPEVPPFFVNTMLLSEKKVELYDKYLDVVQARYGSKFGKTRGFEMDLYADVVRAESDYIYIAAARYMHDETCQPDPSLVPATLYWALSCHMFKRFPMLKRRNGCPEVFADQVVTYEKRKMSLIEAWMLERGKLESSEDRVEMFFDQACKAYTDLRRDWAVKVGLLNPYTDSMGRRQWKALTDIDPDLLVITPEENDFAKKDEQLFAYVRNMCIARGATFRRPSIPQIVTTHSSPVSDEKKGGSDDGFRLLTDKKLDSTLQDLLLPS